MKLIKQSYEILEQPYQLGGIYKQIELAGRNCYKSEDKITEFSAVEFTKRMIKANHGAMLEHGTVYLKVNDWTVGDKYTYNDYTRVTKRNTEFDEEYYITTNMRVLFENGWFRDLRYLCEPTEFHEKRITVKFTTSNSIMRELTRHRTMSFAIESTRYCNYNRNRFNNQITFIQPYWFTHDCAKEYPNKLTILKNTPIDNYTPEENLFLMHLLEIEERYMDLINLGLKAQEAREILPLATKCDMIVTGFVSDWKHLFNLRCDKAAHPDMRNLINPLKEEFIERELLK